MINRLTGKSRDMRCEGRSTAQALMYVAQAIYNPNTIIKVSDHYGTQDSNRLMVERCREIVSHLGLQFFDFNKAGQTICCNLFKGK